MADRSPPARHGVILAGGRARRMGQPKGGALLGGRPLVEHVADTMRAAGLDVSIVTKAKVASPVLPGCRVLTEPDEPVHALAGIAHALDTLGAPIVVCPCDMPFVPAALLAYLAGRDDADAVVLEHDGFLQPLVGRYATEAAASVRAAITAQTSAHGLIRDMGRRARVVPAADLAAFGDADRFMRDIDTPEELARAHDADDVATVDAATLVAALGGAGAPTVVDVRAPWEWRAGHILGAVNVPLQELRRGAAGYVGPLVTVCAVGHRARDAAATLRDAGHTHVRTLEGGMAAWAAAGLPVREEAADPLARYRRQTVLPEVGEDGQRALAASRVLQVGAGALGSPCALYLAGAGVGTLGLADHDAVEVSNLSRQIMHTTARAGQHKLASAAAALGALNPDVMVEPHDLRLDAAAAMELVGRYDVVVDATDNLTARYALNAACVTRGVPLVWASIVGLNGQAGMVLPGRTACYACVFPHAPDPALTPGCDEAGVLGPGCGILGSIEAAEVLKHLLGITPSLGDRLLMVDVRAMEFTEFAVTRDRACPVCGTAEDG